MAGCAQGGRYLCQMRRPARLKNELKLGRLQGKLGEDALMEHLDDDCAHRPDELRGFGELPGNIMDSDRQACQPAGAH
jgi:hypothetical protein